MRFQRLSREKSRGLLFGFALVGLVAITMALGTAGSALAQGDAPEPGWMHASDGERVFADRLLANGDAPVGISANPGNCSLHTLRGSYVFAASGYNIAGGVAIPKAIVEPIDFHGDGTLSVPAATVSVNGMINRIAPGPGGEYTLDAACKGTLTFTGGPSFDIYLAPSGNTGWMIQINPNTVFQGTVTRVAR
jgi:hypothetical protein